MEPTIFKPRLKFKPPLKFFKFGHWYFYFHFSLFKGQPDILLSSILNISLRTHCCPGPRVLLLIINPAVYTRLVVNYDCCYIFSYRTGPIQFRISNLLKLRTFQWFSQLPSSQRQISQWAHELWSDIQTNRQTEITTLKKCKDLCMVFSLHVKVNFSFLYLQ